MNEQKKTNEPKPKRELIDRRELIEKARRIIGTKASYKAWAMLGAILDAPAIDIHERTNNKQNPITVSEIMEEVTEAICNHYCKWPEKYAHESIDYEIMLEEKCDDCPLNRLS